MNAATQLHTSKVWTSAVVLIVTVLFVTAGGLSTALAQDSVAALIEVTPFGNIDKSTYNVPSFQITNKSEGDVQIDSVTFDISTAIFPDLVFDPSDGTPAGDVTYRNVTPNDSLAAVTGYVVPEEPWIDPYSSPHQDGYYVVTLAFEDFNPGETFHFGADVDPTSIKGFAGGPGPKSASHVSGLELVGSTVTVEFSDGTVLTSNLYNLYYRKLNGEHREGGSYAILKADPPEAPTIEALEVTAPAVVDNSSQTIRVTGPVGAPVRLLQVDARLYIEEGTPNGGFDLDSLEANSAVAVVGRQDTIGSEGYVDIPVTLLETPVEEGPDGGLNYFVAVVMDTASLGYDTGASQASATSNVVVLKLAEEQGTDTAVENRQLPEKFVLKGNYPNPFNPTTTIAFNLPVRADVTVRIFDMLGRPVMVMNRPGMAPGARSITVDASGLASGVYFYRVIAEMHAMTAVRTGRMTFIK